MVVSITIFFYFVFTLVGFLVVLIVLSFLVRIIGAPLKVLFAAIRNLI